MGFSLRGPLLRGPRQGGQCGILRQSILVTLVTAEKVALGKRNEVGSHAKATDVGFWEGKAVLVSPTALLIRVFLLLPICAAWEEESDHGHDLHHHRALPRFQLIHRAVFRKRRMKEYWAALELLHDYREEIEGATGLPMKGLERNRPLFESIMVHHAMTIALIFLFAIPILRCYLVNRSVTPPLPP